ncbi:MAG: hypothetical protein BGO69_00545 [Bacteroidetes bacterium 46-16]|nr:MAG: hypothetical protein BGO69_00545 [Bacteroidetes bacterium 46-16]
MSFSKSIKCIIWLVVAIGSRQYSQAQTQLAAAVPATYDVTPTGAFTFDVPIEIPPGIKNIMPNLSISYNSQGTSGMLGIGWTISGLSSITRTTSTIDHNKYVGPVDFSWHDMFILDGQRLFVDPQNPGTYLTETKNFAKIQSFGTAGIGPSYFTVETLDGIVYEYGNTTNAKMIAAGRGDVLVWALNKVQDRNGNYMEFDYINDNINGEYRISSIKYTGNATAGVLPTAEIDFNYSQKADLNTVWLNGSQLSDKWKLDNMTIQQDAQLVSQYTFAYDVNDYTHLKTITNTRCDATGCKDIPPITINWGNEDLNYATQPVSTATTSVANTYPHKYSLGDFNGDGITDFVRTPTNPTNPVPVNNIYEAFLNNKQDDFFPPIIDTTIYCQACSLYATYNLPNPNSKMMFDYNGDGKDDMLIITYLSNNIFTPVSFDLYLSNGNGFDPPNRIYIANVPGPDPNILKVVPGDFDGDGKKELLILEPVNQLCVVYNCQIIGDEYPPTNVFTGNFLGYLSLPTSTAMAIDFDGDGKDELLRLYDSQNNTDCEVDQIEFAYDPNTGKPTPQGINMLHTGGLPYHDAKVFTGDFNGDGKTDVLSWWKAQPQTLGNGVWMIHYSRGDIFDFSLLPASLSALNPSGPSGTYLTCNYDYFVSDFNGDGKSDIIELHAQGQNPNDPTDYKIFYSKGNNEFNMETGTLAGVNGFWGNFDVGDFNGDGQSDLLYYIYDANGGDHNQIIYFHKNEIKHTVTSILNADHWIKIETIPLPQDPDYVCNIGAYYPFNSIPVPIKVVKTVRDLFGITALGAQSTYKYQNAEVERRGLGFRGFQTFIKDDQFAEITTTTTFDLSNYPTPLPQTIEKQTFYNEPVSSTHMQYVNYNGGANGSSHIVLPLSVLKQDLMNNTVSQEQYDYGVWTWQVSPMSPLYLFGKPDKITHTEGNDVTVETTQYFDLNAPYYNMSKPIQVVTNSTYNNNAPYVRTTNYTYDTYGLPATKQTDPNTPNEKTLTNTYDDFGNIVQKDLVAGNTTLTNQYTYTADGRFLESSTNPLQYQEHFTYNPWGAVLSHTTADGLQTTFGYDQLNRELVRHLPNGTEAYTAYDYSSGPYAPLVTRFMTTSTNNVDQSFKTTFFDFYDKPVRTAYSSFNDVLYEDVQYYPNGLVQYKTQPYKHNALPSIFTNYAYDHIGRETSRITTGGGATIQTSYAIMPSGLEVSAHNIGTGQIKITHTSTSGKMTDVIDNGSNTITYDYNSNGKLAKTILSSTNPNATNQYTINYQYDNYGRLTQKTEPNAGTSSYQYNALDQLVSETDANGTTYTHVYDLLGRETERTGPEGTYLTTYNNTPNTPEVGKVNNILSPNNSQVLYTYNSLGQKQTEQELIDNQNLISQYDYDNAGRLAYITYPTGNRIQHLYNTNGVMNRVDLVSGPNIVTPITLWQLTDVNELGKTKQYTCNNGMYETDKDYSPLGFPLMHNVTNMVTGHSIKKQTLNFNPMSGNLTQRVDLIHNWEEDFQYDTYDRLNLITAYNTVTNTGPLPVTMLYNSEGNITHKQDVTTSNHDWKYIDFALQQVPEPWTLGNVIPTFEQDVTYTPFKKVATIVEDVKSMNFTYGPLGERWKAEYLQNNAVTKTRYYAGNFEKTINAANNAKSISYIWAGGEMVAILIDNNSGTHTYFTVSDHLGSITHILDDHGIVNDGLVEERSFDAWGRMRDPVTFNYYTSPPTMLCDRGYTGHEHLNDFNIINMNGRLYDPLTCRMYSPDPVLIDNTSSQQYNKYTYALNNPLKYTDPSGNFIPLIAAVGAVAVSAWVSGVVSWYQSGDFVSGAIIGGAASVISLGVGSCFAASSSVAAAAISGAASGAASGLAVGMTTSIISGNSWEDALFDGLRSAGINGAISAVTSGLAQGLSNIESGKDFWSGEMKSASSVSNHVEHIDALNGYRNSIAAKNAYNGSAKAWQNDLNLASRVQGTGLETFSDMTTQLDINDSHYGLSPDGVILKWNIDETSFNALNAFTQPFRGG